LRERHVRRRFPPTSPPKEEFVDLTTQSLQIRHEHIIVISFIQCEDPRIEFRLSRTDIMRPRLPGLHFNEWNAHDRRDVLIKDALESRPEQHIHTIEHRVETVNTTILDRGRTTAHEQHSAGRVNSRAM
jgi:hypothetical protein